jgi:hypothetical protein
MMVVEREIPIRTKRGGNNREHHFARSRRVKEERRAVFLMLRQGIATLRLPAVVLLTRGAPSAGLDGDNLQGALKAIRDEVAKLFGVDDRDPRIGWQYAQERTPPKRWFVRVRVMAAKKGEE